MGIHTIWSYLDINWQIKLCDTWWFIPLSKWVITPVINGISRVNPLITGVITHLLSGMNHQVLCSFPSKNKRDVAIMKHRCSEVLTSSSRRRRCGCRGGRCLAVRFSLWMSESTMGTSPRYNGNLGTLGSFWDVWNNRDSPNWGFFLLSVASGNHATESKNLNAPH